MRISQFCLVATLGVVGCGSESEDRSADTGTAVTDSATADVALDAGNCVDATAPTAPRDVQMSASAFTPACLQIRAGQKVRWVGDTNAHTPTDGRLEGPFAVLIGTDTHWETAFRDAGVFAYYDKKNPTVRGEVRVAP